MCHKTFFVAIEDSPCLEVALMKQIDLQMKTPSIREVDRL